MKLGVAPGNNAWVDVSQIISSIVGLVFVPATSGEDALPVAQVRFSQGRSLAPPSVDVNTVCPSSMEPTIIKDRCESPFANASCTNSVTSKFIQSADAPVRTSDIPPRSLVPIAPGLDQLFTPSYVVPFALVFHATSAG